MRKLSHIARKSEQRVYLAVCRIFARRSDVHQSVVSGGGGGGGGGGGAVRKIGAAEECETCEWSMKSEAWCNGTLSELSDKLSHHQKPAMYGT